MNSNDFEKLDMQGSTVILTIPIKDREGNFLIRVSWGTSLVDMGSKEFQLMTTCVMRFLKIGTRKPTAKEATFYGGSICNPNDTVIAFDGYMPSLKDCYKRNKMERYLDWHDLRLALRQELERL
jgi:hypothetical protein